jgi:leucyl-tRNA synthetase
MTLAPEHELVAKITTPEQKAAVEATLKELQNVPKENVCIDVKHFGVFTGHMLSILLQRASSGLIGDYVLAGYGTGAVMAVPVERKIMLC